MNIKHIPLFIPFQQINGTAIRHGILFGRPDFQNHRCMVQPPLIPTLEKRSETDHWSVEIRNRIVVMQSVMILIHLMDMITDSLFADFFIPRRKGIGFHQRHIVSGVAYIQMHTDFPVCFFTEQAYKVHTLFRDISIPTVFSRFSFFGMHILNPDHTFLRQSIKLHCCKRRNLLKQFRLLPQNIQKHTRCMHSHSVGIKYCSPVYELFPCFG